MIRHLQYGVTVSLFIHGIIVLAIVYLGTLLSDITPPLTIDFSIEKFSIDAHLSKVLKESREQPAEKLIQVVKPKKPEQKLQKTEASNDEIKKIVPSRTKKQFDIQEKTIHADSKPVHEPIMAPTPNIENETAQKTVSQPLVEKIHAEEITPSPQHIAPLSPASAPEYPPTSQSLKEKYLEANYSYIRDTIARNTSYPKLARKMGWEGNILISFTISTDGGVEDIRIIKSCGFNALDKNAIKTIRLCAPFPKPIARAEVTLPITYRLY